MIEDISWESEVHNIYQPEFDSEDSEVSERSEQEKVELGDDLPFLKKVQSCDPQVEALDLKDQERNNSNKESFKNLSLFTKGPVLAHHNSLALNDPQSPKNSKKSQKSHHPQNHSNHPKKHKTISNPSKSPSYPFMKEILTQPKSPSSHPSHHNHPSNPKPTQNSLLHSLSASNSTTHLGTSQHPFRHPSYPLNHPQALSQDSTHTSFQKSLQTRNSFIQKLTKKENTVVFKNLGVGMSGEETAATMGLTGNTGEHNYFGLVLDKGGKGKKGVKRIRGFKEIVNVKNLHSPGKKEVGKVKFVKNGQYFYSMLGSSVTPANRKK